MSSTAIYAVVKANASKLRSIEASVFSKLDAIDTLGTVIECATNYPLAQKIAQRALEEYAYSMEGDDYECFV